MTEWLDQLWHTLTAVSLPILILGLALQAVQTVLIALAWRNILRAAYPDGGVQYDKTLAYYAGGNGLNAFLPASAGTVAMLGWSPRTSRARRGPACSARRGSRTSSSPAWVGPATAGPFRPRPGPSTVH